jgi:isopenicillin-N N-acyltransferase-like protein
MSKVTETETLRVLHCSGTPSERGRQQGEELRPLIELGVGRWLESIGARHQIDPDEYVAEFLRKTSYRTSIERWSSELLLEVHGIAAGAGQPVERMLVYSMLDEEWRYSQTRAAGEQPGCTAVGVRAENGRPTLIGQTMDIPSLHDGTQVVIIHEEQGAPTQAVFTAAGMICLMGVNSAGVGVVVNNLSMLPSARTGLPVTFIERKLLDTYSVDEASYGLQAMPHAIGQHYLIGDPEHLVSFEADAARVIGGAEDKRVISHTNHPLYDAPTKPEFEAIYAASNTRARFACMTALSQSASTLDDIEKALTDTTAPISRSAERGFMTFGAMAAKLSSPPNVRFAAGPPHQRSFVEVEVPAGGEQHQERPVSEPIEDVAHRTEA